MADLFPCKNCPNKGCGTYHSQCEPYQAAIKRQREIKEVRYRDAEIHSYMYANHNRIEAYVRKHRNVHS